MRKTKDEIIQYINSLKNYQGYVQFSDKKIRECDIFQVHQDIQLALTDGFVYEAHFCNSQESIAIKQVNGSWLVATTELSNVNDEDMQEYLSDIKDFPKIKMAHIWKPKADELCEGMEVMKLEKVVFAGFVNG